ncbi:hypothetical protein PFLUV_G00000020 [Perca fluviatilis]|uniref:Uncharacterized protein n=1 Tax=Perca fluviatilis TaxID=8168 RepID=A0A6A5FQK3_PERFL|nr:hypothetical protein PFLUV_G00000020 [Perca fluviatilis]
MLRRVPRSQVSPDQRELISRIEPDFLSALSLSLSLCVCCRCLRETTTNFELVSSTLKMSTLHYITCHLAEALIQSDLQLSAFNPRMQV